MNFHKLQEKTEIMWSSLTLYCFELGFCSYFQFKYH